MNNVNRNERENIVVGDKCKNPQRYIQWYKYYYVTITTTIVYIKM